jgi:hypothetical protein
MTLMIRPAFTWQYLHSNITFRQIATPFARINRNLMPLLGAILGNAQHIALHAAIRKIFKN